MEYDGLNSPETSAVCLEVRGHQLQFAQEKNSRKGKFCPSKLKVKRVIELGAGCGLAGFGGNLTAVDEKCRAEHFKDPPNGSSSIEVSKLDWGNEKHIEAVDPPFDYIIDTDVVYAEHLLDPLLKTIRALAEPKTSILMHSEYQHPSIQLCVMNLKFMEQTQNKMTPGSDVIADKAQGSDEIHGIEAETTGSPEDNGSNNVVEESHQQALTKFKEGDLREWEARRYGSTATSGRTDSINYPFSSLCFIILVLSFHLLLSIGSDQLIRVHLLQLLDCSC